MTVTLSLHRIFFPSASRTPLRPPPPTDRSSTTPTSRTVRTNSPLPPPPPLGETSSTLPSCRVGRRDPQPPSCVIAREFRRARLLCSAAPLGHSFSFSSSLAPPPPPPPAAPHGRRGSPLPLLSSISTTLGRALSFSRADLTAPVKTELAVRDLSSPPFASSRTRALSSLSFSPPGRSRFFALSPSRLPPPARPLSHLFRSDKREKQRGSAAEDVRTNGRPLAAPLSAFLRRDKSCARVRVYAFTDNL